MHVFQPRVAAWFKGRFPAPTPVQELAWPRIAAGAHVLATAPTGTGKTLAAFLHALDRLAAGAWDPGRLQVLYVSPLKALVSDVRRNLLAPILGIGLEDVRADIRTGDTPASERRRFGRRPPSILCTTPESLNLLLATPSARPALRDLKAVILDEIHAVAGSKRGAYLMTAVERLPETQRIALSATVRPLGTVAAFVGGPGRRVEILEAPDAKRREVRVVGIGRDDDPSIWPHVVTELKRIVKANRTTAVFVNNRAICERLVRWLNEGETPPLAYAHHGSLARELRAVVEKRLQEGALKAIVATSSLELGIDIGGIDEVVLVQSPRTLSSAIQRVGRAGHSVGETSRARLLPVFQRDVLDAAVMAPLVEGGAGEEVRPVRNPLDVLAQAIVAACAVEEQDLGALYAVFRRTHTYAELTREAFDRVVAMLRGRYAETRLRDLKPRLRIDPETGRARAADGALQLVWRSGGVIPDRGYYPVRVEGTGARLGELDEEFVWERRIGQEIAIGAQQWRIDRITRNEVVVTPGRGGDAVPPFWKAESQAREFELCERIGLALEEGFPGPLPNLDAAANDALTALLDRQRAATGRLPDRHHLVLEETKGTARPGESRPVIVHAMWGDRVLRPWAIAMAAAFEEERGYPLDVQTNDDGILVHLPGDVPARRLLDLVPPDRLDALLRRRLHQTGFFGTRFRENAMRALLLPRHGRRGRTPLWLTRMRAAKLMQAVASYGDFPILLETWRMCLEDEFDLPTLRRLLGEIESGELLVSEATTDAPSPFAQALAWRATNQLMYDQNERAPAGGAMPLSEAVLRDVLRDARLRPKLDPALVQAFLGKLQRTDPLYAPRDDAELVDLVEERLLVPAWEGPLAPGLVRDRGCVALARDLPLLDRARGGDATARDECLSRVLATHGPVTLAYVEELLGMPAAAALDAMVADGRVIADRFTADARDLEFCDAENLERLLRLARAAGRTSLEPLPGDRLPQLLARVQREGDLRDRLERLFGFPAPAALWEEAILPAQADYRPADLDALFQESDLLWLGTGAESLAFAFEDEARLFLPEALEVPEPFAGRHDFFDLQRRWGLDSAEAARRIWELAWAGRITADSFAVVRHGVASGFEPAPAVARRGGLRSWQSSRPVLGTWRALRIEAPADRLEELEDDKARARQLLLRYGVLFRELSSAELPPLRWGRLLRALRLLELAGECFAGHFLAGFEGLQFASRDALSLLRGTWDDGERFWMNACDPASPCGVLPHMPPRVPSTWLAFRGRRLVLAARRNGRDVSCPVPPEPPDLALFEALLSRAVRPLPRVVVETIDDDRAAASPHAAAFREAGFENDMDALVLERTYA
ncbi:MAG TPA: DEAD/DEAH box helicase [Planctomycetota bacterium]|nr:DEAD/DEAH box helicase [Planctomycetota bacterium]